MKPSPALLLLPLFAPLALAQDYTAVLASIQAIKSNTTALTTAVDAVTPGLLGLPSALQVQVSGVTLSRTLNASAATAAASAPFGDDGSRQVAAALVDLQDSVRDSLNATVGKKDAFGDLSPVVLASLYALKEGTEGFGGAVAGKLEGADNVQEAGQVFSAVEGYFGDAVEAYGGEGSTEL